jgi:hypothetical protein
MFFEPRSKGLKAIQRRVGRSKAIANISASFETLEPRQCCDAKDDVFTKTAADFAPSADPNKNLVTSLDVLANDTARSGNKADLSIGVVLASARPTVLPITSNGSSAGTVSHGYLKLARDNAGNIKGIQYALPIQAITPLDVYQKAENRLKNDVIAWGFSEQSQIMQYYMDINTVIDRLGEFVRSHHPSSGALGSTGSSAKDIGSAAGYLSPVGGAVLSVGGRAFDFILNASRDSRLETFDSMLLKAKQDARDARTAELNKSKEDFLRLKNDLDDSCLRVSKQVFGNDSFVYSETDGSPIVTPPSVPWQLGGTPRNIASASVRLSSSALVTINLNIEDYSAKLAHLNAWAASHDLDSHKYDKQLKDMSLDDMYGDALISFAGQAGFQVAWEGGQWAGRDGRDMSIPRDGGYYTGVMIARWYTFDSFDVADQLNKIKYKKK